MVRVTALTSPLLLGFDDLERALDKVSKAGTDGYPPYNIERTGEDSYRLTMAVAGFSPDELEVTVQQNSLLVTGKAKKDEQETRYLHRGIARRAFERHFSLADHLKVTGADVANGMLHVDLTHEIPEAAKPRKITIGAGEPEQVSASPKQEPVTQRQAA